MSLEKSVSWIRTTLIPRVVNSVACGKHTTVSDCQITPMSLNKDGFASILFAVDLYLEQDGKQEYHALIVKIMLEDLLLRTEMQSEKQFANEILLYSKFGSLFESIPGSQAIMESLSPKYYYSSMAPHSGTGECSEEDGVVVLENLKPEGYQLGDRISLDFDHTILALQQLGRYHALSYALKTRNKEKFYLDIVSKIEESFHIKDMCESTGLYHSRINDALEKLSPGDTLGKELTAKISDWKVFERMITPEEPLAVLCHGDFCRNNMLFKYDDNNKPCDVKFIDFQTIRYASPGIDLSFFIFMNTTAELRAQHWDQLLKSYHNEVRKTLAGLLGEKEENLDQCYNFDKFKEDFQKHALYGYLITITFLPQMLAEEKELQEVMRLSQETGSWYSPEVITLNKSLGGAKMTALLVGLAQEMRDRGLI